MTTTADPDGDTAADNAVDAARRILLGLLDWSGVGEVTWRWLT